MTAEFPNPVSHFARQQKGKEARDKIAAYITQCRIERGMSPTVRELADHLDVATTTIQKHLAQMEKQGRVVREGPRTVRGYSFRVIR